MEIYNFTQGNTPVLISIPHGGTLLPYDIAARITNRGLALTDTDFHVKRLYNFAEKLDVNILSANYSRYVVDLNRSKEIFISKSKQPQKTSVIPAFTFDKNPIYKEGLEPKEEAVKERIEKYWQPYHDALEEKISKIKEQFGIAVVIEAHSIAQYVPLITDDPIPSFSLGTNSGKSCSDELEEIVFNTLSKHSKCYNLVKNQLFKGGYITKNYGKPKENIHVYQLELSKDTYMASIPPCEFIKGRANKVRIPLKSMVQETVNWALKNAKS